MSSRTDQAAAWLYRGVWRVLVDLFYVPQGPPPLPAHGSLVESFRPAPGFLRYQKFYFWLLLLLVDLSLLIPWTCLCLTSPFAGAITALPVWFLAIAPDIIAYIAIHLRYDTTWYVLTDRSMRLRRGVWIIHETTITYENIQNVTVRQGPVQRHFGIADVVVHTAGGGGGGGHEGSHHATSHLGLLQGLDDAHRVRDLILAKLRQSRTAGLGDDPTHSIPAWTPAHLAALREIRDRARALTS